MLGFKTFLTEEIYKWDWMDRDFAKFTTPNDIRYSVSFHYYDYDGVGVSIGFGSFKIQDPKNKFSIISTVVKIIQEWVAKNRPNVIKLTYFTQNRQNIFDKKLKLKHYKLEIEKVGISTYTRER